VRIAALVLAVAAGVGACAVAGPPPHALTPAATSPPMPPLAFPLLDGGTFSSADAAGEVLLVDVWATYCEPCRKGFPHLAQLAAARPGLVVVGLSIDEGDDEAVGRFLSETPAGFPVARDREASALAPPLSIRKVPTILLIDRAGRLRLRIEEPTDADYRALPAFVDALRGET
jgi:cytochrome c biogenesis protein CcmG/thiol:disulfide interchange protein DsbE